MRKLPAILLLCGAIPATAATLRPSTMLHAPTVQLRDLFDDPGEHGDRVLGPGPAPGGRIVVEAAQLRAIARQFDVDWTPASSADRAVLERPGFPMSREDALVAVRSALVAAGASPDCTIELTGFTAPLIPLGGVPRPLVSQLEYDSRLGRFVALLSVSGEGMEPINLPIAGQVQAMLDLPVATATLTAGSIVGPDDVHMARVGARTLHGDAVRSMEQVTGMQLTHTIQAGQPVYPADLTRPLIVRRGSLVRLRLESGGLSVTGQGIALESGADGERIRVQNPGSRTVLAGIVIGPGLVRIAPGLGPEATAASGAGIFRP
jgi:flagella basal body P-ring formation protein FlgA